MVSCLLKDILTTIFFFTYICVPARYWSILSRCILLSRRRNWQRNLERLETERLERKFAQVRLTGPEKKAGSQEKESRRSERMSLADARKTDKNEGGNQRLILVTTNQGRKRKLKAKQTNQEGLLARTVFQLGRLGTSVPSGDFTFSGR